MIQKKHLVFIGFSCTGKTSLGSKVASNIIDSDVELRTWLHTNRHQKKYDHIYEIFMDCGRPRALELITQAEMGLIDEWANRTTPLVASLGPGFPLHGNWPHLRRVSHVVLFERNPESIYESLLKRREKTFSECPDAKNHDNWDVGVIVDNNRKPYSRDEAIRRIKNLIDDRTVKYSDNDGVVNTDDSDAEGQLRKICEKLRFGTES